MPYNSLGVQFFISTNTAGSTGATCLIGSITDFNALGGAAAIIDVTNIASTAKEKLAGLYDEGQITMSVSMDSSAIGHAKLREVRAARSKITTLIHLNDSAFGATGHTQIKAKGFVTSFPFSGSVDGKLARNVTIEVTGGAAWSSVAT